MNKQKPVYRVVEDNAGGMYLFLFGNNNEVMLAFENIEFVEPGDLDNIVLSEIEGWDSQLENPQKVYGDLLSNRFGWSIVADQDGVYADNMGRAAQRVYGIEGD